MEDFDDDEYGYIFESIIFNKFEKEDINLEDIFMDFYEFCFYKREIYSFMVSRGFFFLLGIFFCFVF